MPSISLSSISRKEKSSSRKEKSSQPPAEAAPAEPVTPTDGELLGLFTAITRGDVENSAGSATNRSRSEAAFRQLIERHGPMVWGVCLRILGDQQEAEDAFQATFLILSRQASKIRASESAAGWLYRVARHTALAARRKAQQRKESRMDTEPLAPPEAAFPDLAGREAAGVLMEELTAVPAKFRTPLVLQYFEGCSRSEIAELTDTTVATVQGRIARGKAMLRSRLLRRGVSFSTAIAIIAGGEAALAGSQAVAGAGFAHLIAQTTSNATAIATGGSITASSTLTLLYKEGVSFVLLNSAFKLAMVAMAGLLLLAGVVFSAYQSGHPAPKSEPVALDVQTPNEASPESLAVTFDLQAEQAKNLAANFNQQEDHAATAKLTNPLQATDAQANLPAEAAAREGGKPKKILRDVPINLWNPFKKLATLSFGVGVGREKPDDAEDANRKIPSLVAEIESGKVLKIELGNHGLSWSLDQGQEAVDSLRRESSPSNPATAESSVAPASPAASSSNDATKASNATE